MNANLPSLAAALALCAFAAGCAAPAQTRAIRAAADSGAFQGIDSSSQFSFGVPNSHSGPYSAIGRFNAKLENGTDDGQPLTFVLAKSRASRQWEVLDVLALDPVSRQWNPLPSKPAQ